MGSLGFRGSGFQGLRIFGLGDVGQVLCRKFNPFKRVLNVLRLLGTPSCTISMDKAPKRREAGSRLGGLQKPVVSWVLLTALGCMSRSCSLTNYRRKEKGMYSQCASNI